jgi:hypothetical protein
LTEFSGDSSKCDLSFVGFFNINNGGTTMTTELLLRRFVLKEATLAGAVFAGPLDRELVVTGYLICETESPKNAPVSLSVARKILHPVRPDDPDPENEVAYSQDPLRPLMLTHKGREAVLTDKLYTLFRYVYDIYRTEGTEEFPFAEIACARCRCDRRSFRTAF